MNNSKVVILGAGHVGSHAAYALAQKGICSEIVLVDIDREKAVAQALDVDDSVGFGAGETFVRAGEYGDVSDAAVVINAIGEGRKPGQTRLDLLGRSAEMAEELITSLKHFPIPGIFISITNPCDVIADYMRKGLELKKERAFGTGTLLDTARLVRAISRRSGAGRASIQAFSLGEHGDSSMIPFDAVKIGGLGTAEYGLSEEDLLKDTRESGMVIIEGKKSTEFGIGSAAADLVKCILLDEKRISAPEELRRSSNCHYRKKRKSSCTIPAKSSGSTSVSREESKDTEREKRVEKHSKKKHSRGGKTNEKDDAYNFGRGFSHDIGAYGMRGKRHSRDCGCSGREGIGSSGRTGTARAGCRGRKEGQGGYCPAHDPHFPGPDPGDHHRKPRGGSRH